MYAEVDVLLTLEQYQEVVPETLACYDPYGTLIRFETITIPVSHISELGQAPLSLLKWNSSSQALPQVPRDVSALMNIS